MTTYRRVEAERRWQLDPARISADGQASLLAEGGMAGAPEIEDRYLRGTRLRLRTVRRPDGTVIWKLGHKVPLSPGERDAWCRDHGVEPAVAGEVDMIGHTTLYLDEGEIPLFTARPADRVVKTRYRWSAGPGCPVLNIDRFGGEHAGLIIAECDLADPANRSARHRGDDASWLPPGVVVEIGRHPHLRAPYTMWPAGATGSAEPGASPPRVLVIEHSEAGRAARLTDAFVEGCRAAGASGAGVVIRRLSPSATETVDVEWADAVAVVTSTRFGALPGTVKDWCDRCYRQVLAAGVQRPVALVACGESDPTGVTRQLTPILTGLGWRFIRPPVEVTLPSGAGDVPAGAGDVPAGAGDVPAGAGDVPAGASDVPAGAGDVPAGAGDVPAGAGDIPAGASEMTAAWELGAVTVAELGL